MTGGYVLEIPEGYIPGNFNIKHLLERGKQSIGVFSIDLAPGVKFMVEINKNKSKACIVVDDDNVSDFNKELIDPGHQVWKYGTPHKICYYVSDVAMKYLVPF